MLQIAFLQDDAGAVTIDWVALAAGILVLAVGVIPAIYDEMRNLTPIQEEQLGTVSAFQKIE
jgi:hypothetical protein